MQGNQWGNRSACLARHPACRSDRLPDRLRGRAFGCHQWLRFPGRGQDHEFHWERLPTIAVTNAQTVVSNATGTQLLVFSNDSDAVTVLSPALLCRPWTPVATPTLRTRCARLSADSDRPVYAVVNGNYRIYPELRAAMRRNVSPPVSPIFDLRSLTITRHDPGGCRDHGASQRIHALRRRHSADLSDNACTGQTTAATICGRLDVVDLSSQNSDRDCGRLPTAITIAWI